MVVLTHLGANLDSRDPRIVDGLVEVRQVIAVGYRGVGASTEHIRDSIEDMAEGMLAVIRAPAYDRVDFFGIPMGGMVAQAIISQAPERRAGRDWPGKARVYPAQLAAVHRWGPQQTADLSPFTGPVLIVHGHSDRMVPPANATGLAKRLPSASVTSFPDSGHGLAVQNRRAFVSAARTFLRR